MKPKPEQIDACGVLIPESKCPRCGHVESKVTRIEGDLQPKPGDFCLCGECASILVFKDDMTPREAELNDLMKLCPAHRQMLYHVQSAIEAARGII